MSSAGEIDYFAVVREAWDVVRRNRALLGFGAVQAAFAAAYGLLIAAVMLPLSLLGTFATTMQQPQGTPFEATLFDAFDVASGYFGVYLAGVIVLFLLTLAVGVAQVSAEGGLVAQTVEAAGGRPASFSAGFARGSAIWWRMAALFAIAAAPGLAYLLVEALSTYAVVARSFGEGLPVNIMAMSARSMVTSTISSVLTLVTIPLGVLIQLSIRFAVVGDRDWRESLSAAWALMRAKPGSVALMYLVLLVVSMLAVFVVEFVLALVALVFVGVGVAAYLSEAVALTVGVAIVGVAVIAGAAVLIGTVFACVYSAGWTLFWLRITRIPDPNPVEVVA